jgi:hypothetical protein
MMLVGVKASIEYTHEDIMVKGGFVFVAKKTD